MRRPLWLSSPDKVDRVVQAQVAVLALLVPADQVDRAVLVHQADREASLLLAKSMDSRCGQTSQSVMCHGRDSGWAD